MNVDSKYLSITMITNNPFATDNSVMNYVHAINIRICVDQYKRLANNDLYINNVHGNI